MAIVQGNDRMVGCLLGVVDIGDGVGVVRERVLLLTGGSLAFFGHRATLQMPSSLAQVSVYCLSVVFVRYKSVFYASTRPARDPTTPSSHCCYSNKNPLDSCMIASPE